MDMSQFGAVADACMPPSTDMDAWGQGGVQMAQSRQLIRTNRLHVFRFVTLYTHGQRPLLAGTLAKEVLLDQLQLVKGRFNLGIAGYVVLDDHVHFLCATRCDMDLGPVVAMLRDGFTREWRRLQPGDAQAGLDLPTPVWRSDIFSYRLTMVDELHPHLNFIHYDAVRHGYVERAADYTWSSLPARVEQGHYPEDWAIHATPAGVAQVARALYLPI